MHKGLKNISRKSDDVTDYDDNWASDYNETLAEWRYDAPQQAASMHVEQLSPESVILDAGYGTGLSGRALHSDGFTAVDGVDISHRPLKIDGMSGAYNNLCVIDMQRLPLPIPDNQYDGLVCVGVLIYLTDGAGTLREYTRIVRSRGIIVFSQRSDLFKERKFRSVLKGLSDEGMITHVRISEPRPYLPGNEEFGDKILAHYISYRAV
jgi:predicted TPR repeat methyltransferase